MLEREEMYYFIAFSFSQNSLSAVGLQKTTRDTDMRKYRTEREREFRPCMYNGKDKYLIAALLNDQSCARFGKMNLRLVALWVFKGPF